MNSFCAPPKLASRGYEPAKHARSRPKWILPCTFLFIYLAQCAWFVRTQSFTFDEPLHIVAGRDMWRHNRFQYWNDQPPLSRLLCTLPILGDQWEIDAQGHLPELRPWRSIPAPEQMATRGRALNVMLGLLLALLVWITARRMFSEQAANFALALFAFSPGLIAHFSLITTDGAGTLLVFATAVQLLRWRHDPSRAQTVLLGIVLGLLLLAKFYTPPIFLVVLGWLLIFKSDKLEFHPLRWNWGVAASVCALALVVLWAGYFFHVSWLTMRDGQMLTTFPNRDPISKAMWTPLNFSIPVPAGEYLEGLKNVAFHNHMGHKSFFLGQVSQQGGWKLYYPVAILLKWPTVILALLGGVLVLWVRKRVSLPEDLLIAASLPAVLLILAIFSKIAIGDRHILPLYPFVLLFITAGWQVARRLLSVRMLLLLAIALNAIDVLRYTPDYLSYFTPFVSSRSSFKLLSDSNLDWGQGLLEVRDYEAAFPQEKIYLAYFGSVEPAAYGLRAELLTPDQRVSGATVMVSATQLTGQWLGNPAAYHWVLRYPEKTVLNHTLHVFEIPSESSGWSIQRAGMMRSR